MPAQRWVYSASVLASLCCKTPAGHVYCLYLDNSSITYNMKMDGNDIRIAFYDTVFHPHV